jgi:membrane-associated phospholipid phosphatase
MTALATHPGTPAPGAGRPAYWRVASALALSALSAAGVAAIYLVFVRTSLGQHVDEAAMRGAEVRHARVVTVLSNTLDGTSLLTLAAVALVAATIGLLRRRADLAVAAGILVLGANLTTQALKLGLDRPSLGAPGPNSLPSGHTTAAVSVAFALVLVLPYAARAALALAGTAYVTVIAVATVWAGWHRPSDTIAALLVVLAWGSAAIALVRTRRSHRAGRIASRLATVPLALGGAVAGFAGLLGLGAVALSEQALPGLVPEAAPFLAGSACIAAASAITFLIWVRLVADDEPVTPDAVSG